MTRLTLAQTLHGYEQGHGLLAFGGDVDETELRLLDRLSDLPGYLPSGLKLERYFTGFPCGRYYAFACTWPDLGARRGGTVLTHTLLIPLAELPALDDLWQLHVFHRQPGFERSDDPTQRERRKQPFRRMLEADVDGTLPPPPDESRQRGILALMFAQSRRPILWMESEGAEPVVRWLWSLLWREVRAAFSFCTLGLAPRKLQDRSFDFLRVPPESQADFLEFSHWPGWWHHDGLSESVKDLLELPHLRELLRAPLRVRRDAQRACATVGLPMPPHASSLPLISRYFELRDQHSRSLSGARAQAELLAHLWILPASHEEWSRIFENWMTQQSQALLDPRPLWELTAMLSHSMMGPVCRAHPKLIPVRDRCIETELTARLSHRTSASIEALPELLRHAERAECEHVVWTVLQEFLDEVLRRESGDGEFSNIISILVLALTRGQDDVLFTRCEVIPDAVLTQLLDTTQARVSAERLSSILELLLADARARGSVFRTFWLTARRAPAATALTEALSVASQHNRVDQLQPCFQGVALPELVGWSLSLSNLYAFNEVSTLLAQNISLRTSDLKLLISELDPALRHAVAMPDLLADLSLVMGIDPVLGALMLFPDLQEMLLERALNSSQSLESSSPVQRQILVALVRRMLQEDFSPTWIRPLVLAILRDHEASPLAGECVERLGPVWVASLWAGEGSQDLLAEWLSLGALRQWLWHASSEQLKSRLREPSADALSRTLAVLLPILAPPAGPDQWQSWWLSLVLAALERCSRADLDASAPKLQGVLRHARSGWGRLAWSILERVRVLEPICGHLLLVDVFPPLYEGVLSNQPGLLVRILSLDTKDWDKARPMREWLLEAWCRQSWPVDSLERLLAKSWRLREKFLELAEERSDGRELIRRLTSQR